MTTIATRGTSMAGDGMVNDSESVTDQNYAKVLRLEDGRIVGIAGSAFDQHTVVAWLNAKQPMGTLCDVWERTEFMVLNLDGSVHLYNAKGQYYECDVPQAIGSGMGFALGAMAHGATALEAVEIASGFDLKTGGEIIHLELEDTNGNEAARTA